MPSLRNGSSLCSRNGEGWIIKVDTATIRKTLFPNLCVTLAALLVRTLYPSESCRGLSIIREVGGGASGPIGLGPLTLLRSELRPYRGRQGVANGAVGRRLGGARGPSGRWAADVS